MKQLISLFAFSAITIQALPQENNYPNILWIYVDDMSDWIGCYGDLTVPTPNIDALAENGVRFDRAFMPAPICSATRSALITSII